MCIAIKKVEPLGWHLFLLQKITILYLFYTWKVQGQFIAPPKDGIFEWTATVLNINPGYNEKLLSACKPLKEYAILIEIIKEYRQKYDDKNVAIEKAIEECINCNVLKDFLLERKAEAMHTLLTEYDEEETMGYVRRDAYRDGEKAGIEQGLKQGLKQGEMLMLISMVNKKMQKGKSIEEIAEDLEEDKGTIEKIANVIKENGHDINADEVYKMLKKK